MSEKYIDLASLITDEIGGYQTEHAVTLNWLDRLAAEHPDQVPGRTMTESEISKAFGTEYVAWARLCLARIGITVVPDPEPTNAELLARDLDELNRDGFLIHNRHKEMIANLLIERGWVKQAGGEAR